MGQYPNQYPNESQPPYGNPQPGYGQPQYAPQYVPSGPMLSTPTGIYPLAGFWWRVLGSILDSVILWIVGAILTGLIKNGGGTLIDWAVGIAYPVGLIAAKGATLGMMPLNMRVIKADGTQPGFGTALGRWAAEFLFSVIAIALVVVSFLLWLGPEFARLYNNYAAYGSSQTFANDFHPSSSGAAIFVIGLLLAFGVVIIDVLWAAWDPRKQTLHDKMAGTFVIKLR